MKKATIIFSFSIITILSIGSFFIHLAFLSSYKKEFRAYLSVHKENAYSSEITIKSNELYKNNQTIIWEDDNTEIIYKGVLYDIVSIQKNKDNAILTLVSDTAEEEIKNQFASNYNENSNKHSDNSIKLLKQFLALQYISPTTELFNTSSVPTTLINHKDYLFYISSGFLSQETPPPNFSI